MYAKFWKRVLDIFFSLCALLVLSPVMLILIILGTVFMRGNPFFTQSRPGKDEKIFNLIKFRTMNNRKDKNGNLLPDDVRLNKYGRFLRSTSMDEIPELINILIGDMSIIGPRPLLVEYLPYYYENERHRHDIRPGLTGWAQINGRNAIDSWEQRFAYDLEYIKKCSFVFDVKIVFLTIYKVVRRFDIQVGSQIKVGRLDNARKDTIASGKHS